MKWKVKPMPKEGDRRTVRKFLLFPRWINGEGRWLETVTIQQEWRVWWSFDYSPLPHWHWENIAWVDITPNSEEVSA